MHSTPLISRRAILDDLVEEFRYGGDGSLWRQSVVAWARTMRKPVVVTALVVALYGLGRYIPVPGVSASLLAELRRGADGRGEFALWDLVTGGNLSRAAVFAFGIVPYITGSTLVQSAIALWKAFTRRTSSPPARRIAEATRITAFVLCAIWSSAFARLAARLGGSVFSYSSHWPFQLAAMTTPVAGMALLIWVSDYITRRGIANGMMVVFIAGIIGGLPFVGNGLRAEPLQAFLPLAAVGAGVVWIARGYRAALMAGSRRRRAGQSRATHQI